MRRRYAIPETISVGGQQTRLAVPVSEELRRGLDVPCTALIECRAPASLPWASGLGQLTPMPPLPLFSGV